MQPVVVNNFSMVAGNATSIVNAYGTTTSAPFTLATTQVGGVWQRRLLITSGGNDSGIYFHIIGFNQANFTISEFLAGSNGGTAQSNLDYLNLVSIQPSSSSTSQTLGTTASTVSIGVDGVGSSLWNIMNWHATPTNIECSGVVTSPSTAVNWGVQYTYDDPNNLPAGVYYPQAFGHPTLSAQTASLDGPINDPVTAVRFIINSGTGSIRGTIIQAGIGSP
jgi:hypothetical protein